MLRSDLCDYSDVYILVKRTITVERDHDDEKKEGKKTFKNNAPFRSCILKINNTFIDIVEELDIVMPLYNLLEYSNNYSVTSGRSWHYYREEVNDNANENANNNNRINNNKSIISKPFEYKKK